jgi:hypothetical protein
MESPNPTAGGALLAANCVRFVGLLRWLGFVAVGGIGILSATSALPTIR